MSWQWRIIQNLKRNCLVVSKLTWEIWWSLIQSQIKIHFNVLLLSKVYIIWAKKVQGSYLSWHSRVMQNLKKNWLVVWKMKWGISQIFTRALESVKIRTLMGYFCPEQKMYKFKICKIWRGIDLSFKNWHEKFDKFWLEHSKI